VPTEPWVFAENPSAYWDYNWYSDDVPARKFYLFLAELGRRLRPLMTDPGPVAMIDLCEQCADGRITEDELADLSDDHQSDGGDTFAAAAANGLYWYVADRYKVGSRGVDRVVEVPAFSAAVEAGLLSPEANYDAFRAVAEHPVCVAARERTALEWGALVRDVYGPDPFRPVTFDPAWRSDTAVSLARGMYDSRDFAAMPILADALQDAGCDRDDMLSHCRDPQQVHVRGCWVVDLVLGKS
jgi:hypothetical protein